MYNHTLKVYGQYLAEAQALPQNASADGNGPVLDLDGTMGGIEIVAVVTAEISLADTKSLDIKLQDSEDGETFADLETLYSVTADGATTIDADTVLERYVLPSDAKAYIKAVLTTDDAAAAGSVSVYPTYLAR